MKKEERYEELCKQIKSLTEGVDNRVGALANTTAAMKAMFPKEYFWVGFYLVKGDALELGPFQGSVACYVIPYGKGVCGTAWKERKTRVVPDVELFPGHIACSSLSRSEIVVPIYGATSEVVGVIDIDSTELSTFDSTDGFFLEKIAKILAKELQF